MNYYTVFDLNFMKKYESNNKDTKQTARATNNLNKNTRRRTNTTINNKQQTTTKRQEEEQTTNNQNTITTTEVTEKDNEKHVNKEQKNICNKLKLTQGCNILQS
jgi:hypothetical protein